MVCSGFPSKFRDTSTLEPQSTKKTICSDHKPKTHPKHDQAQRPVSVARTLAYTRRPRSNESVLFKRQREHIGGSASGSRQREHIGGSAPGSVGDFFSSPNYRGQSPVPDGPASTQRQRRSAKVYPWRDIPNYSFVHSSNLTFYIRQYR